MEEFNFEFCPPVILPLLVDSRGCLLDALDRQRCNDSWNCNRFIRLPSHDKSGVSLAQPTCIGSGSSTEEEESDWAGPEEGMKGKGRRGDV